MRASRVLQKCLPESLGRMHALRERVLLKAVEALVSGTRLTLIDLARSWPGAERVRAPHKALDRLLGNAHLHAARESIHAEMSRWLLRGLHPVIVIDWSDLKPDKRWCLLRAAVPVGGRTLTLLEQVHPGSEQGSPKAERRFLKRLQAILPKDRTPILVTDAGFRRPWFEAVEKQGWYWLGRMRGSTLVKPVSEEDGIEHWVPWHALHVLAQARPCDLGRMHMVRSAPFACRMVVAGKPSKGRKHRTRLGAVARNSNSRKSAARERDPWLLVSSPELEITPRQMVALYGRRMQIESSFRDLKSHRYGHGFEDSLTRKARRIEVLLLIHALALFASWLAGLGCEATGIACWLSPRQAKRKLYSTLRIGREALVRQWPMEPITRWLERLQSLPPAVTTQMQLG